MSDIQKEMVKVVNSEDAYDARATVFLDKHRDNTDKSQLQEIALVFYKILASPKQNCLNKYLAMKLVLEASQMGNALFMAQMANSKLLEKMGVLGQHKAGSRDE